MGSHTIVRRARAGEPSEELRSVLDDIRRLVRFLRVASRESERTLGISGAQLFVLRELAQAHALSLNELAQRTFTHQSSVSVVVSRLVERKLVSRVEDPKDARRVQIALTSKGRALVVSAPEAAQLELIAGIRRLSPVKRRGLAGGLQALSRELGVASDAAPLFFEEEQAPARRGGKRRAS